jgi:hypothetical protein
VSRSRKDSGISSPETDRLIRIGPDARFFLAYRRTGDRIPVRSNVFDTKGDDIASPQLAVDDQIKQRQVKGSPFDLGRSARTIIRGNVGQIFASGIWPTETGLRGWAFRTRTGESVRELSDWNCVTTSPDLGASPAAETVRVRAA